LQFSNKLTVTAIACVGSWWNCH